MTLLVVHTAAALFMTGVVWFVQLVHYPLMRHVGAGGFARYEAERRRRTSPVVAPVMFFETATGLWLALSPPAPFAAAWLWANAAALAVIWVSTVTLQIPTHRVLDRGFDGVAVDRLVATNWIRTLAWSARAVLLLALLMSVLRAPPVSPVDGLGAAG